MGIIIKVAAVGIVATVCALLLKKDSPAIAFMLTAAAGTAVFIIAGNMLSTVASFLDELAELAGVSSAVASPLIKTIGISLVTRFSAEASRDAKETAIASYIEFGGTMAALYVCLPLMRAVIGIVRSLSG